jgi:hypothetical protein
MKIVSIGQIVEINHKLMEKDLPYKIHLKDACGAQSFSIEVIDTKEEKQEHILSELLEEYFEFHKMKVVYTTDEYHFIIK